MGDIRARDLLVRLAINPAHPATTTAPNPWHVDLVAQNCWKIADR
jgi:hypothetical protein